MSQRDRIVLKLRELILSGDLAAGQRVAEIPLSERLGVSRTPVRQALTVLAKEGLLVPAPGRGYEVRAFTLKDILDAIELRGVLEGMAVRLIAEAGARGALLRRLEACLEEGLGILEQPDPDASVAWAEMNARFHGLLVDAADNQALVRALQQNDLVPFAGAERVLGGSTTDPALAARHRAVLRQAQRDHERVVEALRAGQGARAEALMREHAQATRQNILLFHAEIPALAPAAAD